jgi:hypothetical protein
VDCRLRLPDCGTQTEIEDSREKKIYEMIFQNPTS